MTTQTSYISVKQAAEMLNVSRTRVYKMIQEDKLSCYINADNRRMVLDADEVKRLAEWRNEPPWKK